MQIFPDVHQVDGVDCNVYIITEPDGLTIVDAGLPGAPKRILAAIAALGHSPRDVRHLLLTHQHVDHIGGLARLAAATGAETWASVGDTPAIEGRAPYETPRGMMGVALRLIFLPRLKPGSIGHVVRDGETLPVFASEGGLRVVETPGHTSGHIAFYLPARKLLFAGDAVRSNGGRLPLSPALLNTDTAMALESVRKLAAMDIEACLPGHGAPVLRGAQALLDATAGQPSLSRA